MSLRVQAVEHLARHLEKRLQLKQEISVLEAPPSQVAVFPACSIVLDSTDFALRDDLIPVDSQNQPLLGSDATLEAAQIPPSWGKFDDNTLIYNCGRYVGHCRIFVGSRLPAQRADYEERVHRAFLEDDLAPGRILMAMNQPLLGDRRLPWTWPCVAILPDGADVPGSSWTPEYAFAERLYSWIKCDVEVDILVPRHASLIQTLRLAFTVGVDPDTATQENYDVDQTGDLTPVV